MQYQYGQYWRKHQHHACCIPWQWISSVMQAIPNCVVADTYGDKYRNESIALQLWLYYNDGMCEELLNGWFVYRFNSSAHFYDNTKIRPKMRGVFKYALESIKRVRTTVPLYYKKWHPAYPHITWLHEKNERGSSYLKVPMGEYTACSATYTKGVARRLVTPSRETLRNLLAEWKVFLQRKNLKVCKSSTKEKNWWHMTCKTSCVRFYFQAMVKTNCFYTYF